MKCWRIDLRRNFSLYVTGELEASAVKRVEDHLLDCGSCRTRIAHLRNGHRLALEAPRFTPQRDPWPAIEAAIEARRPIPEPGSAGRASWRKLALKPGFALAVIGVAALIAAVLVASGRRAPLNDRSESLIADVLDPSEFHVVNIAGIEHNTEPHVVAEGYVSEVRVDNEDGDLMFKLVDDIQQAHPFIVCEIINPKILPAPSVGSRVRVYGVSRYDNQENHNWYEVHPVLNIEVVKH